VIAMSHSPFLYIGADEWGAARRARTRPGAFADQLPIDNDEVNAQKHARCMDAMATLRARLTGARPDMLLIFGDDQGEQFRLSNFPALGIFVGEEFTGFKISEFFGVPLPGVERKRRERTAEHWITVKGVPDIAKPLAVALVKRGFDMAFCTELVRKDDGIGHAFMRPSYHLNPDYKLPILPIFINCFYGPQPTGHRCRELGSAVREIVAALPASLRVAVIGSGGLWHTPIAPNADVNPAFDKAILAAVESGNATAMAHAFDTYPIGFDLTDVQQAKLASGGTGMVLGVGGGSGETRNWIAAAAVADGRPGQVVDYVAINASPIGVAFAYWDMD